MSLSSSGQDNALSRHKRGFNPRKRYIAKLAQLVELLFCKQKVVGSIPAFGFGGCSLFGKASVCDTGEGGFEPHHSPFYVY